MDMSEFGGEYFLKPSDVRDGPILARIVAVRKGEKYDKPELVLANCEVLSLNKTRNGALRRAYGDNSNDWIGKQIKLSFFIGKYEGEEKETIVVTPISPPKQPPMSVETTPPTPANGGGHAPDDDIPFAPDR